MENQHTNIIIKNVPLRFDRNDFSIVNLLVPEFYI